MQKNSTDDIAVRAWNATRKHWMEFILFPILVTIVFGILQVINFALFMDAPSVAFIVMTALCLTYFVFTMSFFTALAKWSSELHKGAKKISIQDGLHYGLSRFWGVLGTCILTYIKIVLWTMLLVLPGIYKGTQYLHSIQVSQLDGVSGGEANKLSKAVIMNAGILRTFSNMLGIHNLVFILTYAAFVIPCIFLAVAFPGLFIADGIDPNVFIGAQFGAIAFICAALFSLVMLVIVPLATTFMLIFINFHYIMLRDEQKTAFNKAKKAL